MQLWDPTQPSDEVVRLAQRLEPNLAVLDIGSNEGPHSFFFSERGCQVVALEPNPEIFEKLKMKIGEQTGSIELLSSDLLSYEPSQRFDVIVCTMVLHFFKANDVEPAIEKMKSWTKSGGYNVISAYSDKNPPGKRPYLFRHNELTDLYKGWRIIEYEEKPTPWFIYPAGTDVRRNQAVYLTAQKLG